MNADDASALILASSKGDLQAVQLVIEQGAHVTLQDNDGNTALHHACWKGHTAVARYLLDHGALINNQNQLGYTALHIACQEKHLSIVELLIIRGANVNIEDYERNTALNIAFWKGYTDIAMVLVDNGAVINDKGTKNGNADLTSMRGINQPSQKLCVDGLRCLFGSLCQKGDHPPKHLDVINEIDKLAAMEGQSRCVFGKMCNKSGCDRYHVTDEDWAKVGVQLGPPVLCTKGYKCLNNNCISIHVEPEKRQAVLAYIKRIEKREKRTLCVFNIENTCRKGDSCKFLHVNETHFENATSKQVIADSSDSQCTDGIRCVKSAKILTKDLLTKCVCKKLHPPERDAVVSCIVEIIARRSRKACQFHTASYGNTESLCSHGSSCTFVHITEALIDEAIAKLKFPHTEKTTLTSAPSEFNLGSFVRVLWDIENCSIPEDVDPADLVDALHKEILACSNNKSKPEVRISVAAKLTMTGRYAISYQTQEALDLKNVELISVPSRKANASDDKIKQRILDIEKESITHGTTGTIVLVTGDKDFSTDANRIRQGEARDLLKVIVIYRKPVNPNLIKSASLAIEWDKVLQSAQRTNMPVIPFFTHKDGGQVIDVKYSVRNFLSRKPFGPIVVSNMETELRSLLQDPQLYLRMEREERGPSNLVVHSHVLDCVKIFKQDVLQKFLFYQTCGEDAGLTLSTLKLVEMSIDKFVRDQEHKIYTTNSYNKLSNNDDPTITIDVVTDSQESLGLLVQHINSLKLVSKINSDSAVRHLIEPLKELASPKAKVAQDKTGSNKREVRNNNRQTEIVDQLREIQERFAVKIEPIMGNNNQHAVRITGFSKKSVDDAYDALPAFVSMTIAEQAKFEFVRSQCKYELRNIAQSFGVRINMRPSTLINNQSNERLPVPMSNLKGSINNRPQSNDRIEIKGPYQQAKLAQREIKLLLDPAVLPEMFSIEMPGIVLMLPEVVKSRLQTVQQELSSDLGIQFTKKIEYTSRDDKLRVRADFFITAPTKEALGACKARLQQAEREVFLGQIELPRGWEQIGVFLNKAQQESFCRHFGVGLQIIPGPHTPQKSAKLFALTQDALDEAKQELEELLRPAVEQRQRKSVLFPCEALLFAHMTRYYKPALVEIGKKFHLLISWSYNKKEGGFNITAIQANLDSGIGELQRLFDEKKKRFAVVQIPVKKEQQTSILRDKSEELRAVMVSTQADVLNRPTVYRFKRSLLQSKIIKLVYGDITLQEVDAIVNAANSSLSNGGGIAGAIVDAAGPAVQQECQYIIAQQKRVPDGSAVSTSSGLLLAKAGIKRIIHTVGPKWLGGNANEDIQLKNAITAALTECTRCRLTSIAIPAVSTAIFGFPVERAAPIIVESIIAFLEANPACGLETIVIIDKEPKTVLQLQYALDWRAHAVASKRSKTALSESDSNEDSNSDSDSDATSQMDPDDEHVNISYVPSSPVSFTITHQWSWQEHQGPQRGQWIPYDPDQNYQLEVGWRAYQNNLQQFMDISGDRQEVKNGQQYRVDYKTMQQVNVRTNWTRPVKRDPIPGVPPSPVATSASPVVPSTNWILPRVELIQTKNKNAQTTLVREQLIVISGFTDKVETACKYVLDQITEDELTIDVPVYAKKMASDIEFLNAVRSAVALAQHLKVTMPTTKPDGLKFILKGQQKIVRSTGEVIEKLVVSYCKQFEQQKPPATWEPQGDTICVVKPVASGTQEWNDIVQRFAATMGSTPIIKIERIQNTWLWMHYRNEVEKIKRLNSGQANIRYLFHGTGQMKPEDVYRDAVGFDLRFASTGMWGRGTYFAVNAAYSCGGYQYNDPITGRKQVFLAEVAIGADVTLASDKSLKLPPVRNDGNSSWADFNYVRFDSVKGNSGGSDIFIIYANNRAYPSYLITF